MPANTTSTISVAAFAAMAATAAFLISGGIWLGQLQSRIDQHTDLLAHIDAGKRLGKLESDVAAMKQELASMDSFLHDFASEEKQRHKEIVKRLEQIGWQPYLREE